MDRIIVKERDFIPGVILDKEDGRFEITGKACPENLDEFYAPIFRWLDDYTIDPNDETVFDIKLIYYNTASSKAILKIMQKLEFIQDNGNKVKIRWFYEKDDEELQIAGEDYSDLIRVPFEFFQL